MAKKAAEAMQAEQIKGGCDHEAFKKLAAEVVANPKAFRTATVADHLQERRAEVSAMLGAGFGASDVADLLRKNKVIDVSDQTMRKFIKDNGLAPVKVKSAPAAPKATPAVAPSAAKPAAAKAA